MKNEKITAFALATSDKGYQNQLLGAISALGKRLKDRRDINKQFLLPKGGKNISEIKENMFPSKYKSYKAFRDDLFEILDDYFMNISVVPRIFVTVYNQTASNRAAQNVDDTCRAIKEYYKKHNLGYIFTTVLTSKYFKYKYVDLINIPKHLLTFSSRIKLLNNKTLRKKALITIGTINSFSKQNVMKKYDELLNTLQTLKKDKELNNIVKKLDAYIKAQKHIVLSLGGRVEGPEIRFDINYAKKLFMDAEKLTKIGYKIVFVNSTRTPNDVTDFIYENSLNNKDIVFCNSKNIASSDLERESKFWRIYSGKYEKDFIEMKILGNIYPGILGADNTIVVQTFDSYAGCETTSSGITTAISSKGLFIDEEIRSDCHNLVHLLCPKYAIDWDNFVDLAINMKIEPKSLKPNILSSSLETFAEATICRLNDILKN